MITKPPVTQRRRRAATVAAICGATAGGTVALRHHAPSHGPEALVWQDIGLAAGIVLFVIAVVALIVAARSRR